jgi:hypothetical protein
MVAAYICNVNYRFAESALIDEFSIYTIIFLLISGDIIRLFFKLKTLYVFIISMLSMLIVTIVELFINSSLHNLLPFEILTGFPYVAVFPTIGYVLSSYLRKTSISK